MRQVFSIIAGCFLLIGTVSTTGQNSDDSNECEWKIVFYAGHFSFEKPEDYEDSGLYWMREDGSGKEMLVSETELVMGRKRETVYDALLSPDGRKVAYTTTHGNGILIYDLETKQITELAGGFSPSWSPDSQQVAYISSTDITSDGVLLYEARIVDLLTRDKQTVIASRDIIMEPKPNTGYFWDIARSPDGQQLILTIQLTPGPMRIGDDVIEVREPGSTLVMVSLDGLGLQNLLPEDIQGYRPVWVDKTTIYFVCYTQDDQPPARICRLNLETSAIDIVNDFRDTLPENEWIVDISVQPDEAIAFTRSYIAPDGKRGDLFTFDLNTKVLANLDDAGNAINGSVQWLYRRKSNGSS